MRDKQLSEKENEGPIKSEQIDADNSGKPDSTTTPVTNESVLDGRRISVPQGKDGRRFREVNNRPTFFWPIILVSNILCLA